MQYYPADPLTRISARARAFWYGDTPRETSDAVHLLAEFGMLTMSVRPGSRTSTRGLVCGTPGADAYAGLLRELDRGQHSGICSWSRCGARNPKLRCSRCCFAFYCTADHQREDWPNHKRACRELAGRAAQAEAAETPELPIGTPVRMYSVGAGSDSAHNGEDGVVSGPLVDGRQQVMFKTTGASLPVRPRDLLQPTPSSEGFARATDEIIQNSSALLANLHYIWKAQADADPKLPSPPVLHIEIADSCLANGFQAPLRWRVRPYFPTSLTGPDAHWLNNSPQDKTFVALLCFEGRGPKDRAPTPEGEALRSGEGIFIITSLSRPDTRYVSACVHLHALPTAAMRASLDRVARLSKSATDKLRVRRPASDLSPKEMMALTLQRCCAFCVEPTLGKRRQPQCGPTASWQRAFPC